MKRNWGRAVAGGLVGALVMSAVGMWVAPAVGLPKGNAADMLGGAMGGNIMLGWAAHLMIGIVLALIYAAVASHIPGPPAIRGALYSIAPWLLAMLVVMPMMGMPVFGGGTAPAIGSLINHLAYGLVLGAIYGQPDEAQDANPVHA